MAVTIAGVDGIVPTAGSGVAAALTLGERYTLSMLLILELFNFFICDFNTKPLTWAHGKPHDPTVQ